MELHGLVLHGDLPHFPAAGQKFLLVVQKRVVQGHAGMLAYFGEASPADCLTCDVCRGRRPQAPGQMSLTDAILYLASHPGGSSVAAIAGNLSRPVAEVADCVRRLADDGLVTLTGMNVVRK